MERRRVFSITLKIKNQKPKKMNQVERKVTNETKLGLTPIKNTPFAYATNGEKNYITCGKVILETEKTIEECKQWLKEKPWETIGMMIQAIFNEMLNDKK